MSCTDCPRGCATRGSTSFCGTTTPGRIHWRGVTLLEEHEISPTYEIYFTGCSLRCRFCTMSEAIYTPDVGEWLEPTALVADIASETTPAFRAISFVGGDPSVNLPYLARLIPLLRQRFPTTRLVYNTNLYFEASLLPDVDIVVGDLHFWRTDCARRVASARDYPEVARKAAETLAQRGTPLILRVLALPGHIDCCAAPTAAWAAMLPGDVSVSVLKNYAPVGRARNHPALGRGLNADELRRASSLLPQKTRTPTNTPAPMPRGRHAVDTPAPIEIDAAGRVFIPFVTATLLPLVMDLSPDHACRSAYLDAG